MKNLYGLVLSGGRSQRMGSDKGSLIYAPALVDQRERCAELLSGVCEQVFISIRTEQEAPLSPARAVIFDRSIRDGFGNRTVDEGPAVGILSAAARFPDQAWLVLACDFPWADEKEIQQLVHERDFSFAATAFRPHEFLEPFFTIWEPAALNALKENFERGNESPRQTLENLKVKIISPRKAKSLKNVNTIHDRLQEE